jgi:hypothetical protein
MYLKEAKFGDILAFNSQGIISRVIRFFSKGDFSHVAFVIDPWTIVESTSFGEGIQKGTHTRDIHKRLRDYNGEIWHYKLGEEISCKGLVQSKINDFVGRPSDILQAILSIFPISWVKNDYRRLFCSELCAALLKKGGILPEDLNCSKVTPQDLISFDIYKGYARVK